MGLVLVKTLICIFSLNPDSHSKREADVIITPFKGESWRIRARKGLRAVSGHSRSKFSRLDLRGCPLAH